MYLSFRWYGPEDPIPLQHIRQVPGMRSVVTALYDVPASQVWDESRLRGLKDAIEAEAMTFDVVESIPVHEDIKLGRPTRDGLIAVYRENLALMGRLGIRVLCYNFMPLYSWFRTEYEMELTDGSTAMSFDQGEIHNIPDPWATDLPAYWPLEESLDEVKAAYRSINEDDIWRNLKYFLEQIVPAAEAAGVRLAIHPDDPPWEIFGLPRILRARDSLERLLDLVDSPVNGLTFCTGALGTRAENDLPSLIRRFGHRIHFAHCRNVKRTASKSFHEVAHPPEYGDVDLVEVMRAYADIGYEGPMRPDHGRNVWGEIGTPGYALYDRGMGATYLLGLWDAIQRERSANGLD